MIDKELICLVHPLTRSSLLTTENLTSLLTNEFVGLLHDLL
jgi:hypothetical protein